MLMNRTWLFAGLAALAGLVAVIAWRADSPPVGEASPAVSTARDVSVPSSAKLVREATPPGAADIVNLRRLLDDEIRARQELESEVEALRRQVAELRDRSESNAADAPRNRSQAVAADASADAANAWFDEQALIAAGIDSALAAELKAYFEALELERLQLRDRAAREGWDRARRRDEFALLDEREQSLRERLGDSGYDAYLYAAGRPNRVAVTSVLASAPAAQAGIEPGDYILRYANQRIYDWSDLRAATAAGDLSELVEIEVERDGESMRFYLARGPLGVRTDSRSIAP